MVESGDERVARLEAEGLVSEAEIRRLRADAVASEKHIAELDARALARDEQILLLVKEVEGLTAAKQHAAVIEQAKGMIMTLMHCGPDAAFAALVAASQKSNRKLVDVAAELAADPNET